MKMSWKDEYKLINPDKTIIDNRSDNHKIVLFNEPGFKQTNHKDQYFYDWLNKKIHGNVKFNRKYFHEYSHHLDANNATNDWYRKYIMMQSLWNQFANHITAILILISTVSMLLAAGITTDYYMYFLSYYNSLQLTAVFYFVMMSMSILSTFIDEMRADWKAKKFMKLFNRELKWLRQERSREQA